MDTEKAIKLYLKNNSFDIPKEAVKQEIDNEKLSYLRMLFHDELDVDDPDYFLNHTIKEFKQDDHFIEKNFIRRMDLINQYVYYYIQSDACKNLKDHRKPMTDFLEKHHIKNKKLKELLKNHPDYTNNPSFKRNVDQNELRNFNGSNRVIDRRNLFYLLLQLKVNSKEARALFRDLNYIYTYQANPFDLLFNVAIEKHFSIADTYQLETEIRSHLEKINRLEVIQNVNKNELTMQIQSAYEDFILIDHHNVIKDLRELINELFDSANNYTNNKFHFYSNTIYRKIYEYLYDKNMVYKQKYLKENIEFTSPSDLDSNVSYYSLIRSAYLMMNANMNNEGIDYQLKKHYLNEKPDIQSIRSSFKALDNHQQTIYHAELKMEHYIDRSLILCIAFLTNHTQINTLNLDLEKMGSLDSSNSILDLQDPFDVWFINGCMYINECLEYIKLYPGNTTKILENGIMLLRYSKALFEAPEGFLSDEHLAMYMERKSNFRARYIPNQELE